MDELRIPFRETFSHSSATRSVTEAVIVTAAGTNDCTGLGEGCPRHYVTGESLDSARRFFDEHKDALQALDSVSAIRHWVSANPAMIDKNPAAFCAVELALLNLLSTESGRSIETCLSLPPLSGEFRYTAILGTDDAARFARRLDRYRELGFSDFKVKLFGRHQIDSQLIALLRTHGDALRVRIDANNLWSDATAAIAYLQDLDYPFFAIEEPLEPRDFAGCERIYSALDTPVILDESVTTAADLDSICEQCDPWIVNIRVSKMGGCLRSLAIAQKAATAGIPIVIGAQVGETSILTRAALTIANAFRSNLVGQEGAFGTHLLEYDLGDPSLMFGHGGVLRAADVGQTRFEYRSAAGSSDNR